jgi:hypothetical protein
MSSEKPLDHVQATDSMKEQWLEVELMSMGQ